MPRRTLTEKDLNPEARLIEERFGTWEEIDPNEILIFFKPRSEEFGSSTNPTGDPNEPPEELPDEEQLILHRKMEEALTKYLQKTGHIPPEKPVKK